jgi:ADP-ribose pyrophosphatase
LESQPAHFLNCAILSSKSSWLKEIAGQKALLEEIKCMHIGMKHPVPAVAAIIVKNHEILLIKRGAEPGAGKWSIPGGSMEIGETIEEAVKRETLEETGLVIDVGKLAGVSDLIVKQDDTILFHYILLDYYVTVVSGEPAAATDAVE